MRLNPDRRENPFFHRGAIRDPAYFFGRRRETRLLLELVRNGQSVSVLGQRRIGKTSFLFYVSHPRILQAHGLDAGQYDFAYINCEGRGGLSESDFYRLLLRGLVGRLGERWKWGDLLDGKAPLNFPAFEEGILRATQTGRQVVFMLDEFEAMATNRHLSPDFFSGLRRIATEHCVAYVTVTKSPLLALTTTDRSVLSSPFFNIFQPLRLGLFTADESVQMIQGLASKGGLSFPADLIDFILLNLAGPHPLFLQLAGFHAFERLNARDGRLSVLDYPWIRQRFWATAVQHFQYYWAHLDDESRFALAALPLMSAAAGNALGSLEEQCLVVRRGGGYDYLSSAFRDFVRGQAVPGLVQVGPFVVDRGQHAVVLNDRSLDLTRTQYALFVYLLERAGQVVTYQELEENVWGDAYTGDPERLKAAVKHLRRALGDSADHIANVRGVGYMLQISTL